ncbi:hypothetical protein A4X13_0g7049 [Tilletia indica]|uniref:Uncharacterized protein n=1 Tax=Tilletia indica TaxID=43049 RepID=A0A8T8SL97_9BASI|nr:hypothetical protein A4X13_0g7049 [Tilletia indica]
MDSGYWQAKIKSVIQCLVALCNGPKFYHAYAIVGRCIKYANHALKAASTTEPTTLEVSTGDNSIPEDLDNLDAEESIIQKTLGGEEDRDEDNEDDSDDEESDMDVTDKDGAQAEDDTDKDGANGGSLAASKTPAGAANKSKDVAGSKSSAPDSSRKAASNDGDGSTNKYSDVANSKSPAPDSGLNTVMVSAKPSAPSNLKPRSF